MNLSRLKQKIVIALSVVIFLIILSYVFFFDDESVVVNKAFVSSSDPLKFSSQCLAAKMNYVEGDQKEICKQFAETMSNIEQQREMELSWYLRLAFGECLKANFSKNLDDTGAFCRATDSTFQKVFDDAFALALCGVDRAIVENAKGQRYMKRDNGVYIDKQWIVMCLPQAKSRTLNQGYVPLTDFAKSESILLKPIKGLLTALEQRAYDKFVALLSEFDWKHHPYAHLAVMNEVVIIEDVAFLKAMVEYSHSVNATVDYYHQPIAKALESGNELAVSVLIYHGAHLDRPDVLGDLPLVKALRKGYRSAVGLMLHFGADANALRRDDMSISSANPLRLAVEQGDWQLETLLRRYGAQYLQQH